MDITERKKREENFTGRIDAKSKSHSDLAMMRATDESEYMDESAGSSWKTAVTPWCGRFRREH